jgi:RimJ/RimL family protein N-acetyltransferase
MDMEDIIAISPAPGEAQGHLSLRLEREQDEAFRFQLFCQSRPAEFALLQLEPAAFDQLMRFQFQAQTMTYRANFPGARFDIIELDGVPIGRIVVERTSTTLRIVDQAIVPSQRNRGFGTTIMRAVMERAAEAGQTVRLKVASTNDPSMRLYLRLGFVPIETDPFYIEMEWQTPAVSRSPGSPPSPTASR